ncbi:MAG: nucleotidyltransferase domain-containing protein [Ignavibacteriaceae bacterium]
MSDERLNNIVKIIVNEISPDKLILFGSRGKNTALFNSDYDIAIDSKTTTITEKRKLKEKLEKVMGLYKIDLIFLKEIDADFKSIILKTGKTLYEG